MPNYSFNIRNFKAQGAMTGSPSTSPYVGRVYLTWDAGMDITNPDMQLQFRRNTLQPIITENIFWASECVDTLTPNTLGLGFGGSDTSHSLFGQSRMTMEGHMVQDYDVAEGTWNGYLTPRDKDFNEISRGMHDGYYYAMGWVNKETGDLIELNADLDKCFAHAYSSITNNFNMGVTYEQGLVLSRPTLNNGERAQVYWFMNETWLDTADVANGQAIFQLQSGDDYTDTLQLHCPDCGCCDNITNSGYVDCDYYCPSLCGDPGCVGVHIEDTIGEYRIGRRTDLEGGLERIGLPQHRANEGITGLGSYFDARSPYGYGSTFSGQGGPRAYTTAPFCGNGETPGTTTGANGLYGPTDYPWWRLEDYLWKEGVSYIKNEAWILGVECRQEPACYWEDAGLIDVQGDCGQRITWEAYGVMSQIGRQHRPQLDMTYSLFNYNPTNLSEANPWYDEIDQNLAPFDTIDAEELSTTHCGVILEMHGDVRSAIGSFEGKDHYFNTDDLYVRIDRYKGWDWTDTDDYVPQGGWDNNDGVASGFGTGRNRWDYGKVLDTRPHSEQGSGTKPGEGWDTEGTAIPTDGVTLDNYVHPSQTMNPFPWDRWQFIIPAQPRGHWLYRYRLYAYNSDAVMDEVYDSAGPGLETKHGIDIVDTCGMCQVYTADIEWVLKRNWSEQSDSMFWITMPTVEGEEFTTPKYMYKNYTAAGEGIPRFGDILSTYDGSYYLRCANELVFKGGATVSEGPSSIGFELMYGDGHDDLDLDHNTDSGSPVPGFYDVSDSLSAGDVRWNFNLCDVPEDGKYFIKVTIICDDTGLEQWSKTIPIIVDHESPDVNDIGMLEEVFDGNNLEYGVEATDDEGIAFMTFAAQSNEVQQLWTLDHNYLWCDECMYLDEGDVENPGYDTLQTVLLDCSRTLSVADMTSCFCNGEITLYAYASDLAGNCVAKPFRVDIQGSWRGRTPGGMCSGDHTGTGDHIFSTPVTQGEIYTEMDCCIDSGGTWDYQNSQCTLWGQGASSADWFWRVGTCVDCLGNPVNPRASLGFMQDDQSTCEQPFPTGDDCENFVGEWVTEENVEGRICGSMAQDGVMIVNWNSLLFPSDTNWGMGATANLGPFLKAVDCWNDFNGDGVFNSEDGDTYITNCLEVEYVCAGSGVDFNIVGPYIDQFGHPKVTIVAVGVQWNQDFWNTSCEEHDYCEIKVIVPEDCCGKKDEVSKTYGVSLTSWIWDGECCRCCPQTEDYESTATQSKMGKNAALMYTADTKRWDVIDVAPSTLVNDELVDDKEVGAVAIGKFGEQLLNVGNEVVGFTANKKDKRSWVWHSKDHTMGIDGATKIFKKVNIQANLHFSPYIDEFIPPDSLELSNSAIIVLIDGKEVPIERKDKQEDVPSVIDETNSHLKQWHTYEFAIKKGYQKGKTISVRFQNQNTDSVVDSFVFVYRAKPIR